MAAWLINGNTPESYGLEVAGGEFVAARASSVRLRQVADFDGEEAFAFGAAITITRDGSPFFKGKIRAIPKSADGGSERQEYLVEDAWAELERLTYQEPWLIRQPDYAGIIYSPTVVLGINSAGARINVGQQIDEVLDFAIASDVSLLGGTMPMGMDLWPSEVTGMSCAQVIRDCLKYYPDWIPWIDHSTTPPTFKVTPRATAAALGVAITDCSSIDIERTHDRVPDGVRIVYLTAGLIDGQVYRTVAIDQYPTVAVEVLVDPAPPGILVSTVELAGMQMQIQKQQVQTRDLPTTSTDAKAYLKEKFPAVKDLADTDWNITAWSTAVIPDDYDGDPIDEKLERKYGADRTELPRELVRGNIAEWMQKKVGRVLVEFEVESTGTATEAEVKKIESLPKNFTVVATNAITKIYKGISSFEAAEDVPVGIAQAFYNTIINAAQYAGQITLEDDDLAADVGNGRKLNLTGSSVAAWSTMDAPIHRISWDIASGRTAISFGPNPELSLDDFMEFLKLLNKRPYNQYTLEERTGDELGDGAKISARGDTIGNFDTPETIYAGGGGSGGGSFEHAFKLSVALDGTDWKWQVAQTNSSVQDGTNGDAIDLGPSGADWKSGAIKFGVATTITATKYIVLECTVDSDDLTLTDWTLAAVDEADADEVATGGSPVAQTKARLLIGKITKDTAPDPDTYTASQAVFSAQRIAHGYMNGLLVRVFDSAPIPPLNL